MRLDNHTMAWLAKVQALMAGKEPTSVYDGYTACPVLVGAA